MPCRLTKEEIVTVRVLGTKDLKKTEIAAMLGISEGTVRYHLKREASGARDMRGQKLGKAEAFSEQISAFLASGNATDRPANILELYEHLVAEYGYEGSYKSVLRYVRRKYPRPKIRTYRRVETPPGAQSQTDWAEFSRVDIGQGFEPLSAFIMSLSHSRMPAVIWRSSKDQLSWLEGHNEAFQRLGGVAAVNRIDNVKTAIVRGAGSWGQVNQVYYAYARAVGFHIDACQPATPNAKGKVESKVRLTRLRANPGRNRFDSLAHLQEWTDRRIMHWAEQAVCPVTGKSVRASWEAERNRLRKTDRLPQPFDVVVSRPVGRDCLVHFEGRSYCAPFQYVGKLVEIRGCATTVQIWADGALQREYPRRTEARLLIDPTCFEGKSTDRVLPPPPLGRMGRKLEEIVAMPVEQRPLDLYAALMEVAR